MFYWFIKRLVVAALLPMYAITGINYAFKEQFMHFLMSFGLFHLYYVINFIYLVIHIIKGK